METHLSRNWWLIALRGVLAIIFGVLALIWPGITLLVLTFLFGAYAIVDGGAAIIAAMTHHTGSQRWWVVLLEGLVGILAGVIAFVYPGLTALALVYVIAAWAIVTGALEVWTAIELRKQISNEWLLAVSGIISVLFGLFVAAFPGSGALAVVWLIGIYAIVFGVLFLVLGLRLRGRTGAVQRGVSHAMWVGGHVFITGRPLFEQARDGADSIPRPGGEDGQHD